MNKSHTVAIVITTYNCPKHIDGLLRSMSYQEFDDYKIYIADDGSTDNTPEILKEYAKRMPISLLLLPHGERGLARYQAVQEAIKCHPEFLFIIDGDMVLKKELLLYAVDEMRQDTTIDGLVIHEEPYSNYNNFYTKVKLFERALINSSKEIDKEHSIEAARFWRTLSYIKTGGINQEQIAFEEIQPTLRCLDQGGVIKKLMGTGLYHDEKKVTLLNIIKKKNYYFSKIPTTTETEENGVLKAVKRWYLFRPVYYTKHSVFSYIRHPFLTIGMVWMYLLLTLSGVYHLGHFYIKKRIA